MNSFEYITKIQIIEYKLEDVLNNEFNLIANLISNKKIPNSIRAIYSFNQKLSYIKEGIFQECLEDNLYAVKILYRTFLEHFIKGHYIAFKFSRQQSDLIGSDYYKYSEIVEIYKYGKSAETINKILQLEDKNKNIWDILLENEPAYKNYDLNDLYNKSSQFNYKKMIKYIIDCYDNKNSETDLLKILIANIITSYAELSSFVHGGPQAERTMYELLGDKKAKDNFYVGVSKAAMNLYWIYKSLSLTIFSNYDKEFLSIQNKVKNTINELIKE